jgi:hypothetical protein
MSRAAHLARVVALVTLSWGRDDLQSGSGEPAYTRLSETGPYADPSRTARRRRAAVVTAAARRRPLVPGDVAAAAFGYLHANCGSFHNPRRTAWPDTQMLLRLGVEAGAVQTSPVMDSVVAERLQYYRPEDGEITLRVVPGQPESSGLIARLRVRGPMDQMPPLATEQVDDEGVAIVSRWITSLSE